MNITDLKPVLIRTDTETHEICHDDLVVYIRNTYECLRCKDDITLIRQESDPESSLLEKLLCRGCKSTLLMLERERNIDDFKLKYGVILIK